MKDATPTATLARFAAELEYRKIPPSVIEHVKLCLLDTFGCGLFGSTLPWAATVAHFARDLGGNPESTIWGCGFKVSAPNAALANGTAVHAFELDDIHKTGVMHPGSPTVSSALAVAEHIGACHGKDFLTAVVAGYEVGIRVGISVGTSHLQKGFHPTGTNGVFGAGAAAGKMLRLDTDTMVHCLGIAGTQAAGLMAAQYSAEVKRMHAGRAAQSGVYGAMLAQRGLTGITNILEADYGGYCHTMSDACNMDILTEGLGENFETGHVGFKPYSAGGSTHTGHEAVEAIMRKNKLTAEMIEEIIIHATTATYHHTSWEYKPEGVTAAQMNLPYVVAVTVLEGDIFIDQFSEEKIKDPRIIEFSRRVRVVPDPELDKLGPEFRHTVIGEIRTKSGQTFRERIDTSKGSDKKPMTKQEVVAKFRILARRSLSEKATGELEKAVEGLENMANVKELARLLVP